MDPGQRADYEPLRVLEEREFRPDSLRIGADGSVRLADHELRFIFDFLRRSVKPGALLNLGAGITHVHQMLAVEPQLSHVTALDISPENTALIRALLQGVSGDPVGKPYQLVLEFLTRLGRAFGYADPGAALRSLADKSRVNGAYDVVTADMNADRRGLADGTLVHGQMYDTVLLAFSVYVHDAAELLGLLQAVRQRLRPSGRIVVLDTDEFPQGDAIKDHAHSTILHEDAVVHATYSSVWDWTEDEFLAEIRTAGFTDIRVEHHDISSDSPHERDAFDRYIALTADA